MPQNTKSMPLLKHLKAIKLLINLHNTNLVETFEQITKHKFVHNQMAIFEIQTPTTPPKPTARTLSESTMQEYIENARDIIVKWDPKSPSLEKFTLLFQEDRKRALEFVKCVENLRRAMHFLIAQSSYDPKHLVLANKLMKIAMQRLELEFHHILTTNRVCLDPESIYNRSSHHSQLSQSRTLSGNSDEEDNDNDDQTSKVGRAMFDLKLIAESMISSGYSKECDKLYKITRKSIIDEELYRLGLRVHTPSKVNRMDYEALELQVKKWINASKIAIKTLFPGERVLCDHIFSVSETIKQTCIAQTMTEGAINLFKFPEIVAKCKRSPDKILLVTSLYEAISELWPEIESNFSYQSLSPVKLQALSSMQKLSDSARTMLSEFVLSIQKNSSKNLIPGGGIHPLTFSVMNYVTLLADNSGTLSDIVDSENTSVAPAQSPFPESYFDSPSPTSAGIASRLAWIILVLLCKLDSKAELYKDIGLSYLFLANNLEFVVEKVNNTALKLLLGEHWLVNLQKKVKLYAANYESVCWAKVLSSLPVGPKSEESSLDKAKEHLRQFNSAFEVAYRKQSSWVVPDPKLRDDIKMSIAGKVVPAYREFYDRCMGGEKDDLEVLVRYSPDNLGNYLSDLFHTNVVVLGDYSSSLSASSEPKISRCL
ncbi:hypothetical protein CASFOL_000273 [Castilleja foliolosa]|uniref:Exocyst subunit Exo70 family protein n=1 Tax=Castilleja foliolosa TaxID=1961234 RepID=A0ABD3EN79_9LAMI